MTTTEASADPQGPARDGTRVQPESGTYEWWYFDGQTDDGTAFQIHDQAPAADYTDPRPSVMIHLKRPDGTIAAGEAFVPMDQYRASAQTCDVTIGESTVTGDLRTYRLHIVAGDLAADLTYHSQTLSQQYQSSRSKDQPGKLDVTWSKGADFVHLTYTNRQRVQETYEWEPHAQLRTQRPRPRPT